MNKLVMLASALLLTCFVSEAYAQTHVQGYTRKDGTYVSTAHALGSGPQL